jgi:hypothetical protein
MAGAVPTSFGTMDDADQLAWTKRLAFAAQRGWYYEEWGSMLHQMTRHDSPMAEFHSLLRWMDDGDGQFESETIARGLERVSNPYLALLCSATPHDLAAFMRPGAPYWHDGFWPRFAFITPGPSDRPARSRQPMGIASLSAALVTALHTWHESLGIPKAQITDVCHHGKPTGRYTATREALPCQVLTIDAAVLDAYYAYNDALLDMSIDGAVSPDLDSSYGRFHTKAMRVAMLLASIDGEHRITMPYWAYAQGVTEEWRRMLHALVDSTRGTVALTREEELEQKLIRALDHRGPLTLRELGRGIHGWSTRELASTADALVKADLLVLIEQGKTRHYALAVDTADTPTQEGTRSAADPCP